MPKGLSFEPFVKHRNHVPQVPGQTKVDTTELLLHSDEHPKMDYTAREEDVGETRSLVKHYVGIYDPETDKLEIAEARPVFLTGIVKSRQAAADSMVSSQDLIVCTFFTLSDSFQCLFNHRTHETGAMISERPLVRRRPVKQLLR